MRVRFSIAVGAVVLTIASSSTSAQQDERKWGAFIDFEGKVGTKRNLGAINLFVPLLQDERTLLFGDARFRADDQSSWEGNFGLGVRRMLEGGWNAGFYGFYDHRRSPNANFFDQLTFGAELLGTNFDFRANSYWPVAATSYQVGASTTGPSTVTAIGTTLQVSTPATMANMEYALRGFDAEMGVRIPITPAESPYNLRFYAGGFRFDEPTGVVPIVAGPRLRLEFTDYHVPGLWNGTRFTVGGEWQTDEVRGSQFFAGLRLRVPLQAEPRRGSFTLQERRMTDTIVRDVDIVSTVQNVVVAPAVTESATATADGQTITVIDASTTNSTTGLATAVTGASSTVVLQGNYNTTTTVTLNAGQTVIGSGNLTLRTASGRTVTAALAGQGIVNGTPGAATSTIAMGNNSTLSGVTVRDTEASSSANSLAVRADGVSGARIVNNTISASSSAATVSVQGIIISSGASNITITGNTVTATNTGGSIANGINVVGSTATISNNTITSSGTGSIRALALSGAGNNVTVTGNTLSASGGAAFNRVVDIASTTVNGGSSGNVLVNGVCNNGGGNTGSILFTNGTSCP